METCARPLTRNVLPEPGTRNNSAIAAFSMLPLLTAPDDPHQLKGMVFDVADIGDSDIRRGVIHGPTEPVRD